MKFFISFLLIILTATLSAQIINGKIPSFDLTKTNEQLPVFSFPEVDHALMIDQDEKEANNKEVALRIAVPFETKIDIKKEAFHSINNKGDNEWILKLNLAGAYGVGVLFDQFQIPEGAELYVFNESKTSVNGAITSANNNDFNFLHVSPVQGSIIYVLYIEPQEVNFSGNLSISTVTHLYRDLFKTTKGFGDSGSCNINVVCEEGNGWEEEVRSIALILNSSGSRICTGAMINNTSMDGTQYFLSAKHCMNNNPNFDQWSFIFNYKSEDCSPSVNGLLGNSVFGAELKASNTDNDFALFELTESIPASYDVYFAGWSRTTLLINNTTGIHHPSGDVMKISYDDDSPSLSAYLGGSGDDYWKVADWDEGTTEGGSSGSPLFKNGGKIIGQLRGGYASCSNDLADYYGAFYKSWDNGTTSSERLMDWLDPLGDDPTTLAGVDMSAIGIEEVEASKGLSIYPNPAKDQLTIKFSTTMYVKSIQISDVSGRIIKIIEVDQKLSDIYMIDLNFMNTGVYNLNVIGDDTSLSKTFMIVE